MSADTPPTDTEAPEDPDRLVALENRLDAYERRLKQAEEELQEKDRVIAAKDERIDELDARVEALEDRTDLLDRVEKASALKPEERAAVLIQTLYAKAQRNDGKASIDASGAVDALGGEVSRTLMYGESGVFQRAVDLVGDEDVLWYKKENRASNRNSRLLLDLDEGDLPDAVAGREITGASADD